MAVRNVIYARCGRFFVCRCVRGLMPYLAVFSTTVGPEYIDVNTFVDLRARRWKPASASIYGCVVVLRLQSLQSCSGWLGKAWAITQSAREARYLSLRGVTAAGVYHRTCEFSNGKAFGFLNSQLFIGCFLIE